MSRDDLLQREDELRARVAQLVQEAHREDGTLDELAVDVFRFQHDACDHYRAWCDSLGLDRDAITGWRDVPALPQSAWKLLDVRCCSADRVTRTFLSSGTTRPAERSRQCLPVTDLYELSLESTFARGVLPDRARLRFVALLPPPDEAPESSLVFMVERAGLQLAAGEVRWYLRGSRLESVRLVGDLLSLDRPALLVGTAFSFAHFLDELGDRRLRLPPGSRILETGGFKGRTRQLSRGELHARLRDALDVPLEMMVNQYGMCETSTQFYDAIRPSLMPSRAKIVPPWARVRIVDPITLEERPRGAAGLIQIYDPANLYTCASILTADLGIAHGRSRFEVLGRAHSADLRGCSLAAEDLLPAAGQESLA